MTHGPVTKFAKAWALGLIQVRVGSSADHIATIGPALTSAFSVGALASTKFMMTAEFYKQRSGFPLREDGAIPLSDAAAIQGGFREITPWTMALARGLDPTGSIAATVAEVRKVTTLGTTDATKVIAVTDATPADWAPISDTWVVAFTGATAGSIYGLKTGLVHTFVALDSAMAPVDGDTNKYFSIPASYFTGTWAAGDVYVFNTTKLATAGGSAYPGDPDDWEAASPAIGLGGLVSPLDLRIEGVYTYPDGVSQMVMIFPRGQVAASVDIDFAEQDPAAIPVQFDAKTASSENAAGSAVWNNMPLGQIVWGRNIA
ncbi:MAG: hypothetical protein RBQ87_01285 [Candidatus Cloacimonadaceae bacterium]|jgi:hypothetical protein|nr:hypothetical protein [Candidatus Cloacimonadaceae bacterium]